MLKHKYVKSGRYIQLWILFCNNYTKVIGNTVNYFCIGKLIINGVLTHTKNTYTNQP